MRMGMVITDIVTEFMIASHSERSEESRKPWRSKESSGFLARNLKLH